MLDAELEEEVLDIITRETTTIIRHTSARPGIPNISV